MQYKGLRKSVPEVAADLSVDFLVEGTVVGVNGRVRVTARFVDAVADHELWARSYERPQQNILAVEAEVSEAIAREVNAAIAHIGGHGRSASDRLGAVRRIHQGPECC
jgi:TolB-like protein